MPTHPSADTKTNSCCAFKKGISAPKQQVVDAQPVADKGTAKGNTPLHRGSKTICIPCDPAQYTELVKSKASFRRHVDDLYAKYPELFPEAMGEGSIGRINHLFSRSGKYQ